MTGEEIAQNIGNGVCFVIRRDYCNPHTQSPFCERCPEKNYAGRFLVLSY